MTLVSVLVPAYNAAKTIGETLASAAAQSHRDLEIIVVDDGSIDPTAEIVRRAAQGDPRIVLLQQANAGVAAARNKALAHARGAYVAPLDADDLWHPDKTARQVRRIEEAGPRAGLVYCWSVDVDDASIVTDRRLDLDRFEGDVYAALVLANFVGNASVPLIRKTEIEAIGGWDQELRRQQAQGCEDWQVYLRLAERTDYGLEPAFLVGYRQAQQAMSRQVASMQRSYQLVLAEARARHPDLPPALFRWSAAAFDFYAFELLRGLTSRRRRLPYLLRGILGDPGWLTRPSTHRKLKYWLKHGIAGSGPRKPPPSPIGQPFSALSPDAHWDVSEGATISARRSLVASLPARRQLGA
ncbi:MAG TPA: glycosyltransferase family A protein [Dongiaceae bacterium]